MYSTVCLKCLFCKDNTIVLSTMRKKLWWQIHHNYHGGGFLIYQSSWHPWHCHGCPHWWTMLHTSSLTCSDVYDNTQLLYYTYNNSQVVCSKWMVKCWKKFLLCKIYFMNKCKYTFCVDVLVFVFDKQVLRVPVSRGRCLEGKATGHLCNTSYYEEIQ